MKQKGFSPIIILITCALLFLAATAGAYYFLKLTGQSPYSDSAKTGVSQTLEGTSEISNSEDLSIIEKELDSTVVDSVDSDLRNLDTQASSL